MNAIAQKLATSLQLFKKSILVIRDNPKLLVFPFATGLLMLAIAAFFLAPVVLLVLAPHWTQGTPLHSLGNGLWFLRPHPGAKFTFQFQPAGSALLAGIYLLNMFLATLSSVAFNTEILEALAGRPVSIGHGLETACSKWKSVLAWSLFAGVIGLIIRGLENRFAFVGRLVAGMIGLAWSIASIFAITIMARETSNLNPFEILSKSAKTIKATWGEMLAGYVGMQGTNLMFLWGSLLFWGATAVLAFLFRTPWVFLIAGAPWLVCLLVYGYLSSIASRVYLCALYIYGSQGVVPGPYDSSMMAMAFKPKKS